ncbi:MAG: hypothetical protein NTZ38_02150, partial [Candidatus Taylorbacteria bacterium]|nr:hypothetical protein [Candidatus Taylorbacteria bacterium]
MALWYICGALTVAFVVSLIQTYFEYCDKSFCNRMINRLNILYIQHKGRLSRQQLENPEFRDVVSRSEEKGYWPAMNIALGQFMNLNNAIRIVAALTIIGAYDITLGVWILVSLIPQFVVDIRHGATLWGIFMAETDERRKYGELSRHLRQKSSLAELKMFQNVDYFVTRIREILQNFQDAQ